MAANSPFFQSYSPPPPTPTPILLSSLPQPPSTLIADAAIYDPNNTDRAASVGYGVGVTVAVLVFITSILLIAYCCTKPPQSRVDGSLRRGLRRSPSMLELSASVEMEEGLSQATLMSYPKLLYSKAKLRYKDSTATCCSICLADYKADDVLRMLPDCEHLFHLKCVDPWLLLHPTCPVCRTSPLPTPMSTPMAEVAPLAAVGPM